MTSYNAIDGCTHNVARLPPNYATGWTSSDQPADYSVTQVLPDGRLTDAVIGRTFGAAIVVLDRYLPALLSVIYGNELPVDAVRRVEQTGVSEAA